MKVEYRGFEIEAIGMESDVKGVRDIESSVTRISDGFTLVGAERIEATTDTPKTIINCLKTQVDDYYKNPGDYEDE